MAQPKTHVDPHRWNLFVSECMAIQSILDIRLTLMGGKPEFPPTVLQFSQLHLDKICVRMGASCQTFTYDTHQQTVDSMISCYDADAGPFFNKLMDKGKLPLLGKEDVQGRMRDIFEFQMDNLFGSGKWPECAFLKPFAPPRAIPQHTQQNQPERAASKRATPEDRPSDIQQPLQKLTKREEVQALAESHKPPVARRANRSCASTRRTRSCKGVGKTVQCPLSVD
jgi:hypothetical protein